MRPSLAKGMAPAAKLRLAQALGVDALGDDDNELDGDGVDCELRVEAVEASEQAQCCSVNTKNLAYGRH